MLRKWLELRTSAGVKASLVLAIVLVVLPVGSPAAQADELWALIAGRHAPLPDELAQRLNELAAAERVLGTTSDLVWHKLGLQLNPVDADLVTRVNRQLHGGMEIVAVNADSPAARAGPRGRSGSAFAV